MTTLIKPVQDIKSLLVKSERPVALVPTMGSLHAGHISLVKAAKDDCKTVVVYIFVNPLQFAPNEDFKTYPRDLEGDLKICKEYKVDYVFIPDESDIYPEGDKVEHVNPPRHLASDLCGRTRANHFSGVSTVLKRFFDIVEPDFVYFGEKDLQQLYVVRWLVNEFRLPVKIKSCPTVREENGLAYSSRNKNLSDKQKDIASNLYKSLVLAKKNVKSGIFTINKSILESLVFLSQLLEIKVEYFEARDKESFKQPDDNKRSGFYFLVAGRVGNVRLIDNVEV